jgi:hypothetical protein
MFNWHTFFGALLFFTVLIVIICLIAGGFYVMCETGNEWGYALVVGGIVLGGSIACGFRL